MKRSAPWISAMCLVVGVAGVASAQTTTNITITPTSPAAVPNVVASASDSAPGFSYGSFVANATVANTKSEMYFTPGMFFGRAVALGEVARISYWTKTGDTHAADPRDWFLAIYTDPFPGDASTPGWYGARIGAEPYFSANLNDSAGAWNRWSTDGAANTLRFFESTQGAPGANFGAYTDPDWATFITGNALGTAVGYAD